MKQFLSINQAAQESGLGTTFIRKGCISGTIPHIKSGKKYLVNYPAMIEKFTAESETQSNYQAR